MHKFVLIILLFVVSATMVAGDASSKLRPKVGIVLSGGGARALAQIGVLRVLEQHHIPIDLIVGNSMGSVIGGLYACGYTTTEIESIATQANWDEVLSFTESTQRKDLFLGQKQAEQSGFLVVRFDGLQPIIPQSISSGQRLYTFMMDLTMQALYHPNPSFDGLKIPFRAIATDLYSGKRVIFDHGSLAEALRASVTVPLLYTPLEKDSMHLVDGGLVSNMPVDVAKSLGCDVVVVVNSTSGMRREDQLTAPWHIADQIMTIMMHEANETQMKRADVVITPALGERIVSDFSDVADLIKAGERATEESITQVLTKINDSSFAQLAKNPDSLTDHQHTEKNPAPSTHSRISEVTFTGNTVIASIDIHTLVDSLKGMIYDADTVQHTMERLLCLYRKQQYSLARIDSIRIDPPTGVLSFQINEGVIEDIRFEGNHQTKDYVIRREIPLTWRDIFKLDEMKKGLVNISSLGLFEYVLLDVRYENNRPILVIKVKENSSELLRVGLFSSNERGFVTTLDIRDANFRGAGEDLGLTLRYGLRDRFARFEYRANRIFQTYFTFNVRTYFASRDIFTYRDETTESVARWERIEDGQYKETKIGGSFTFGTQIERLGNATAEIRFEHQRIAPITGAGYTTEDYTLAAVKVQTTVDTENKFNFPTDGMVFSLSYESALKELGSEVSFSKFGLIYESYWTPLQRHTLDAKVTFGFADKTLPLAEQYEFGGLNSFLGLRDDDARGRQLFLFNAEYRYQLPFKFIFDSYVSARYDLGTISTVPEELKFNTFRHGFGVELGLDTPLGPLTLGAGKSFYFRQDLPNSPVSVGPLLLYFSFGPTL